MTPLREIVTTMMLCLRRRYLERQIDGPFNAVTSLDLDAVIIEQEVLTKGEA